MATIDEFALKIIGLWWRYGISRHCEEWKYIVIGRIFESEIILTPPSLKISESSSNGSYRNTDEVWWRYEISRSCDECPDCMTALHLFRLTADGQIIRYKCWINFRIKTKIETLKMFHVIYKLVKLLAYTYI
jgi:hypothetical protein